MKTTSAMDPKDMMKEIRTVKEISHVLSSRAY